MFKPKYTTQRLQNKSKKPGKGCMLGTVVESSKHWWWKLPKFIVIVYLKYNFESLALRIDLNKN